jgi:hypothetical protein
MKKLEKKNSLETLAKAVAIIPVTEELLLTDLKLSEEAEDPRDHAMSVLQRHMFLPTEEWQFQVIATVSGVPADKLKTLFQLAQKQAAEMEEELKELR